MPIKLSPAPVRKRKKTINRIQVGINARFSGSLTGGQEERAIYLVAIQHCLFYSDMQEAGV